jgi:hypothetical protein
MHFVTCDPEVPTPVRLSGDVGTFLPPDKCAVNYRRRFQKPGSLLTSEEKEGPSVPVAIASAGELSSPSGSDAGGEAGCSPSSNEITTRNASISACTRAQSLSFCRKIS